jgi:hypothetical protein
MKRRRVRHTYRPDCLEEAEMHRPSTHPAVTTGHFSRPYSISLVSRALSGSEQAVFLIVVMTSQAVSSLGVSSRGSGED